MHDAQGPVHEAAVFVHIASESDAHALGEDHQPATAGRITGDSIGIQTCEGAGEFDAKARPIVARRCRVGDRQEHEILVSMVLDCCRHSRGLVHVIRQSSRSHEEVQQP
jgi:hypothetical protein